MNLMLGEERPVTTTAEHGVWVHFTAQLGPSLHDQPGQPRYTIHRGTLRRKLTRRNRSRAGHTLLNHQEIISPCRSDKESCRHRRPVSVAAMVIDKVEELLPRVAYRLEKGLILSAIP